MKIRFIAPLLIGSLNVTTPAVADSLSSVLNAATPLSVVEQAQDKAAAPMQIAAADAAEAVAMPADGERLTIPGQININTASAEEIAAALKGIGMRKAEAIVAFRTTHGNFVDVEELVEVKGIGEATLHRIEGLVVLD